MDDDTPASSSFSSDETGGIGTAILNTLIPIIWRGGTIVFGIAAVVAGLLYAKQDSLLYFPEIGGIPRRPSENPRKYRSPDEHQIPYETHMIICDDGITIHSWLLLQPNDNSKESSSSPNNKVPTLVFFHGNAGNIGLRLPNAIQMYQYLQCNVMLVEYRGYGDSDTVKPTEKGLKLDSEATYRYIHTQLNNKIDTSKIYIFGRSLGGAVAFHMAAYAEQQQQQQYPPVAGVIVENTFLSISLMVDHLMPYLALFKSLVLRIGWDSSKIVPTLQTPILYLAGDADDLVPHSHMLELYRLSSSSSSLKGGGRSICPRLYVIKGGTHNETWLQGGRQYWQKIRHFLLESYSLVQQQCQQQQEEGVCGSNSPNHNPTSSISSMDEITSSATTDEVLKQRPIASRSVGMGTTDNDTATTTKTQQQQSSIPTMPTNLVSMVTSAATAGSTATSNSKDTRKKEE